MNASEITQLWIKNNPEKHKANLQRKKLRKRARQKEALEAHEKAKYKTPMSAIKAFCRSCYSGECRQGENYHSQPVTCSHDDCPLFCFRNVNPVRMAIGFNRDTEQMRSMKKVGVK